MQKIILELTPEQAIIMHEITNQIMISLTLNHAKTEFELVEPLPLTFELSHFEQLEETEKNFRNVLENVQGMAS